MKTLVRPILDATIYQEGDMPHKMRDTQNAMQTVHSWVCPDNFVQLFFGWEGVRLTSYLLVSKVLSYQRGQCVMGL